MSKEDSEIVIEDNLNKGEEEGHLDINHHKDDNIDKKNKNIFKNKDKNYKEYQRDKYHINERGSGGKNF